MNELSIEMMENLSKYYFRDDELCPEYWNQILERGPRTLLNPLQATPIVKAGNYQIDLHCKYDLNDYCSITAHCGQEEENKRYRCYISCSHQLVMIYSESREGRWKRDAIEYRIIDLSKGIEPHGNLNNKSILVDDVELFIHSPISYNITIILLKWIRQCVDKGEKAETYYINAERVHISSAIMEEYNLCVDRDTSIPLAIGAAELSLLDYNNISPPRYISANASKYHLIMCLFMVKDILL